VSREAIGLIGFVGLVFFLLLGAIVLPAILTVSARLNESGSSLKLSISLFGGRLRLRTFEHSVGSVNDLIVRVISSTVNPAETGIRSERHRLPLIFSKRNLARVALDLALRTVGKPGCRCVSFNVCARVGLGDAFSTAIALGLAHAGLGAAMNPLQNLLRFAPGVLPVVELDPCFERKEVTVMFNCIFRIYLGYIIGREAARFVRTRLSLGEVA